MVNGNYVIPNKYKVMDYTPKAEPSPVAAPVSYDLQKDVTGKPVPKRINVITDTKGNKVRVPFAPRSNCKKCYGRGYIGNNMADGSMVICRKCYPFQSLK